jgi:hypothetical protein
VERLIKGISPADLRTLEDGLNVAVDQRLEGFWRLDGRHLDPISAERLREELSRTRSTAYRELTATNPEVNPNDELLPFQTYFDRAPAGVDARVAWDLPTAGRNLRFVDLEQGWGPHPDLPRVAIFRGVPADTNPAVGAGPAHGICVLGIVIGKDNARGVLGAAPRAKGFIASHYRSASGTNGHVAETIYLLLNKLDPGDVLLLEVQKSLLPTEIDEADRRAIRRIVDRGVIVVECAGNGNFDLDMHPDLISKDSGAIVVGGCLSTVRPSRTSTSAGHERWVSRQRPDCVGPPPGAMGSNYGARVDCHAWGEDVVTTSGSAEFRGPYTQCFHGTSAAGAIVAGVVLLTQSARLSHGLLRLSPQQMRNLVRVHGTPQGTRVRGHIGVMPDLRRLLNAALAN